MTAVQSDRRLETLAARHAIEGVCIRYAAAMDCRDWEALEACFFADAVYHHPGGRLTGYPAILDRIRTALTPLSHTQHLLGTASIEVRGDAARSVCYFQAHHVRRGFVGTYVIAGTYDDRFLRSRSGWKIAERRQSYTWTAGNKAVVERIR